MISRFFKCCSSILLLTILSVSFLLAPAASLAENAVSLMVGIVEANPGDEVKIPLTIESNSGLASLKLRVKFDERALTLTGVTFPKRSGTYTSVPELFSADQTINFVSPLSLFTSTGTFATLSFKVNENATANSDLTVCIEFEEDDVFDMVFNNVPLRASNGSVRLSGEDIQGDMTVLPQAMKIIEEEAFMNTSFYYVVLPEGATTIASKAFANCTDLKYIYIPESTKNIASDAFQNVIALTIYGKSGSYAQTYAEQHGYTFRAQ